MRFRGSGKAPDKIELQMTPMIDVVFQLLIFFMLTFKLAVPEGDFYINMPLTSLTPGEPIDFQPNIRVRLLADDQGQLAGAYLGENRLGGASPEEMLQALSAEIASLPLTKDMEIEIDADYHLRYQYAMAAVTACSGQVVESPAGSGHKEIVRFVEKIKFAPPRRPSTSR